MTQKKLLYKHRPYKNLKISRELRDIIHGYIMSDGYVKKSGNLTVDQNKKQHKFVEWLYQKLQPIRTTYPISDVRRIDKRTNTVTFSSRFNTRSLLHGFHAMWYASGQKSLPKSMPCFFSPVCISVWFAGDGTKIIGSKGAKIEVTNFSPSERQQLKDILKKKYDISVFINRAGNSTANNPQWTLNINAAEYPKFKTLITQIDLIPKLFPYKLH